MSKESLRLVKSIIGAGMYDTDSKQADGTLLKKPLVTISRYYGAGSTDAAQLLADRLGVQLYDKGLLNAIVDETKEDKHILASLDERVGSLVDDMVLSFLSKKSITTDTYFRYMAKVILGIAPIGGVIVGRDAHLLLPRKSTFRVRMEGSLTNCAMRIAQRKDMKLAKAEKLVVQTNKKREQFSRYVAKRFPRAEHGFDLIINTDRFSSEQVVNIMIVAMAELGFQVPLAKV